jgi:hypothetical protein
VGQKFRLPVESGETMEFELIEATPYPERDERQPREPFSLVFRGQPGVVMPQQVYRLVHDTMGTLELFLVPIQPDEHGQLYEAVFN